MAESKPVLIIIAGPNGSGKTTITSKILKHEWVENCVYINPDQIALDKFGDWNSQEAILSAAKYAEELRESCIREKKSLIFETVFSAEDKIQYIEKAIIEGYFVRFFFVSTNHPSINASRITSRVLQGGHDVPITKIISRYYKSILNCSFITPIVDRLYIYDNSLEFEEAILLFRASNGKITKQYSQINDWSKPIFDSCTF
ncbi:Zeta toxin domain containing protein [Spirosomataceae bacterium]|jgi:predicted ABC-type ATPase